MALLNPGQDGKQRPAPIEGWKSLYLPDSWYAASADTAGLVFWGAVVDEKELPKHIGRGIARISSSESRMSYGDETPSGQGLMGSAVFDTL